MSYNEYTDPTKLKEKILNLKPKEAKRLGISERTLKYWKAKIRAKKELKLSKKTKKRLVN